METQFSPVELTGIKGGKFVADCEAAFGKLQTDVIEHIARHGKSASATGALTVKVQIKYDGAKGSYAIVGDIDVKLPKKPSQVAPAFFGRDDDDKPRLFAQTGAAGEANPRQTLIQDEEHKPITA